MKYIKIAILFFSSVQLYAQSICRTDIMNGEPLMPLDKAKQFVKYNFSDLWLHTENGLIYGIIGNEHQRILIKFLEIVKDPVNPEQYVVKGKSSVKGNVCSFKGR